MANKVIIITVILVGLVVGYLVFIQKFNLGTIAKVATNEEFRQKNEPVKITGLAMDPNFKDGQYWVVDTEIYQSSQPQRGDVVVFKDVSDPSKVFAKRIIGLPEDVIEIKSDKLYVNGEILDEPYLSSGTATDTRDYPKQDEKLTVPEGQYYILGDNRIKSFDSRNYGFVPKANINGKLATCYKDC